MNNARDILRDRVLLFDGGMGTYYRSRAGLECEQANLADPEGVLELMTDHGFSYDRVNTVLNKIEAARKAESNRKKQRSLDQWF